MNIKNKNLLLPVFIFWFLFTSSNVFAESNLDDSYKSKVETSQNIYDNYYKTFKEKYYTDLTSNNLENIKKEMQSHLNDAKYLSENPDSPYYSNMELYKTKARVLQDLINNFSTNIDTKNINEKPQENISSQKVLTLKKFSEFKKTLEDKLYNLQKSINSENIEVKKQEFEELKTEFLKKVEEDFSDLDSSKALIEKRLELFYNNQLVLKEKINETKKIVKEVKEEIKDKKVEVKNQVKEIKKEVKDKNIDSVKKYKELLKKQFWSKIDWMSQEKLKSSLEKLNIALTNFSNNSSITEKNQKIVNQLEALKSIIEEKINVDYDINVEEFLN